MESKEAALNPTAEVSPGSYASSSSPIDNDVLVSKTIDLDQNNCDEGINDVKVVMSEDEGYVSGNEEFEAATDNPISDEIEGQGVVAGNSDVLVKAENGGNDVEIEKVVEGDGSVPGKGFGVGVEGVDGESEFSDSVEKLGVSSDEVGDKVVDGEGGKGVDEELEKGEVMVSEPEVEEVPEAAVGQGGLEEVTDLGGGESIPEKDSVVESVQVHVASPGVVVVGEPEENEDVVSKPEVEVVSDVDAVESAKSELARIDDVSPTNAGETLLDNSPVDEVDAVSKPEVEVVSDVDAVESAKSELASIDDVSPTNEGETTLLDNSPVDEVDAVSKPEVEVVSDVDAVESAKSELVSIDDVSPTNEGKTLHDNSPVDEVDVPGTDVSVVETKENSYESNKLEQKEVAEVKLTPEGDSVVDKIQVDVSVVESGVAVVGETGENGGGKIEEGEVPLESTEGASENGKSNCIADDVSTREVGVDLPNSEPSPEDTVDFSESKSLESENHVVGNDKDETSDAGAVAHLENGVYDGPLENGTAVKVQTDGEVGVVDETLVSHGDASQLDNSEAGSVQTNDDHTGVHAQENGLVEGTSDEPKSVPELQEIREVEDGIDEVHPEDSMSDGDTDGMVFGSSEAAKRFIEELERESGGDSHTGLESPLEQSQRIDGQIVTDSEEEGETDDEGDGKEMFDSAALAALLKAATGADPSGGNITITSQDGSRLFSLERPAGLGSSLQSLRPAPRPNRPSLFGSLAPSGGGESEENLSEEEKKKLEKLQQIRVKFLRLVHRLGLSPEESVAAQVLYRLALLGGRQGTQTFSLDAAKRTALQLEEAEKDDLDFSINILALGKSGVGKSATINSLFGEEKAAIDAFETGTNLAREISGSIEGVKVRVVDTPGLKSSVMEQGINRSILSSVKKFTKKSPPDVVLYVDRLDTQSRDLNDLPLLKTVTGTLGNSIWRSAIVTLTHAASAPPDGPSGTPLSYEVFVSQRSHIVQQSIGHAVGDLRMMSPSLMNPVSLVENHPSCRKNREGQKILPNGQSWRPQLLLLCYSMKILSEASSISKPQDPFDHRKLFGFRARAPPLPYMLSSMLQSRPHPKLPSDQGGDGVDSDIDLDDFSDSDQEEEDEYDQLPPFRPLRKAQIAKLSREQKKAYFEEYDYRVKLLQKKQWKDELKRMREIKKRGQEAVIDYGFAEEDAESGGAAPVAVPLPDMALPPSFDADNAAFRYRFLEPTSQFLARPVLDSHGWDHDCGYDGVNLEHSLAIANRLAAAYTVQITKDKKDFSISLDSSVAAKHGENMSTMAGFDIQSIGKQLAYIVRAETKAKNLKKHKAAGGLSFTFLGDNIVPGVKVEDQITFGKQYALVGSAGAVRSQQDTAYGANFELQRRELDYPIGQVQSTLSLSIIKWRGDLALGFNSLAQFSLGRNSKVAVRAGINNKLSGQITVRTSSSEHLSLALAAVLPAALSIYKKLYPSTGDKYSIY